MSYGRITFEGQPVEDQIAYALWMQRHDARMAGYARASRQLGPIRYLVLGPTCLELRTELVPPWLARIRELVATHPATGATP